MNGFATNSARWLKNGFGHGANHGPLPGQMFDVMLHAIFLTEQTGVPQPSSFVIRHRADGSGLAVAAIT